MNNKAQKIIALADELFGNGERSNSENMWSELSEFMLNNQWSFNNNGGKTTGGTKKTRRVYDSTALKAVQDLSAAFQGTLTNAATVWSKMRFTEDGLNNDPESTRWLEEANRLIHNNFNESNFDIEISKAYQSLVSMGNAPLFFETSDDGGYRFTSIHLSNVAWLEDMNGVVDTVFRKFRMTAKQAAEKWDVSSLPTCILKALEKHPTMEFEFLHAMMPRDPKEVKLNEQGMAAPNKRPIASLYISMSEHKLLEDGGYYEMPIYVPRWSVLSGESYGRSPAHLALPDVRSLNRLQQLTLEAFAKMVDPPYLVTERDVLSSLNVNPKGVTVVKKMDAVQPLPIGTNLGAAEFGITSLRNSIKELFFLDKIQPLGNLDKKERMSQFEVTKRLEEMQSVLGAVLSRLNHELLQPMVVRAFKILLRNGSLPEMPPLLAEVGLDVEIVFMNQLARAQQVQDITNIQQWVQNLGGLAQIKPEVVDNIDADGIARHTAKILGVPEVAVKPQKQVEGERKQQAEAAQQQQQMEQAGQVSDMASKLK